MIFDVLVIGAGPAGLAAATTCAQHGLSVALVDEQPSPGGQIYRATADGPLAHSDILGDDYRNGAALVAAFQRSGSQYLPLTTVWSLSRHGGGFEIALSKSRSAAIAHARAIVIATGALERPFPIPGWTLPGVMMAGAAQALLKTSAMVAQDGVVLAGNGPLLWLVAWQYLRAGAPPRALLDTTPRGRLAQSLRHAPSFAASSYFAKGLSLVRDVRRNVKIVEYVDALEIVGEDAARAIVAARTSSQRQATVSPCGMRNPSSGRYSASRKRRPRNACESARKSGRATRSRSSPGSRPCALASASAARRPRMAAACAPAMPAPSPAM